MVFVDGQHFYSASEDGRILFHDVAQLDESIVVGTFDAAVNHLSLSPDGRWLISSHDDNNLRVWDAHLRTLQATLEGHTDYVRQAYVTTTGRIVSAGSDSTLRVWDSESRELLQTLEGHEGWVCTLAVSPDGKRAVSFAQNSGMFVWNLETGERIKTVVETMAQAMILGMSLGGKTTRASGIGTTRKRRSGWPIGRSPCQGRSSIGTRRPSKRCAV